jgi:hypothetical protein
MKFPLYAKFAFSLEGSSMSGRKRNFLERREMEWGSLSRTRNSEMSFDRKERLVCSPYDIFENSKK